MTIIPITWSTCVSVTIWWRIINCIISFLKFKGIIKWWGDEITISRFIASWHIIVQQRSKFSSYKKTVGNIFLFSLGVRNSINNSKYSNSLIITKNNFLYIPCKSWISRLIEWSSDFRSSLLLSYNAFSILIGKHLIEYRSVTKQQEKTGVKRFLLKPVFPIYKKPLVDS